MILTCQADVLLGAMANTIVMGAINCLLIVSEACSSEGKSCLLLLAIGLGWYLTLLFC